LAGGLFLAVLPPPPPVPALPFELELELGFWVWVREGPVGCFGCLDWVDWVDVVVCVVLGALGVLEVVGALGGGVDVEVEVVGGGELVVVGDEVVVVVGAGVQLMPRRLAPAGREGNPPGGTSTSSVWVLPSANLTVTTHGSAEDAAGRAAIPITTASAVIAPSNSFRLRNTVVNLLPRACSSWSCRRDHNRRGMTLLPGTVVCNGEPSPCTTMGPRQLNGRVRPQLAPGSEALASRSSACDRSGRPSCAASPVSAGGVSSSARALCAVGVVKARGGTGLPGAILWVLDSERRISKR
jgi:hypothetical protein